MKSIFNGSAIVASALLVGSLVFSATPSVAETPSRQFPDSHTQNQDPQPAPSAAVKEAPASNPGTLEGTVSVPKEELPEAAEPPAAYVATAYSLRGRTASGKMVSKGIIAADPRVLPLGSRVHLTAGGYSGEYLVADTGGKIRGRRIDIWIPSTREAFRFGRRTVKLTVLSYGPKRTRKSRRAKVTNTARALPSPAPAGVQTQ